MPLEPDLADVLFEAMESRLLEVHTAIPGKVVSYDKTTQTAEVQPVVQRIDPAEDGSLTGIELPSIPNVPVKWLRGGKMGLSLFLVPGDHVTLIFNEVATGHWRASGELAPPGDLRRHSLGYPIALPGAAHDADLLEDPGSENEAVLTVGDGVFRVGSASAEMVAIAKLTQQALDKIQQTFDAHTHPVPGITPGPGATTSAPSATPIGTLGPVAAKTLKAE